MLAQGVQVSRQGPVRTTSSEAVPVQEVYLKAYQNGTEARKGIGAYLAFYNQERPHQALGYRSPGQVSMQCAHKGVYWNIHESYHRMKVYETPQR